MKKKICTSAYSILGLFALILIVCSCNKEEETNPVPETYERGDIGKTTELGTYSPEDIQQLFEASNVPVLFNLEYNVTALSVNYYTVDAHNNQILTSGAIFIPDNTNNMPMLCMPHGTESKRDKVASVSPANSVEGMIGLMTAAMGYFTVLPDYPGFGVSEITHPYHHAKSIVPCVIDIMRAGKSHAVQNNVTINQGTYITGYSEGGYISLATQKAIEEAYASEFDLKAVAPMAGPYDLKGTVDSVFLSNSSFSSAYAAYLFNAYNEIYGWDRLNDFFKPSCSSTIPGLFDGSKHWWEIMQQLPPTSNDILNQSFISSYNNGNETDVVSALAENTLLDWTPIAPIHFFHGDADTTSPYQNVLTAIEKFTSNGATDIQLTTIQGGTHETAGPEAVMGAINWFESLKK